MMQTKLSNFEILDQLTDYASEGIAHCLCNAVLELFPQLADCPDQGLSDVRRWLSAFSPTLDLVADARRAGVNDTADRALLEATVKRALLSLGERLSRLHS